MNYKNLEIALFTLENSLKIYKEDLKYSGNIDVIFLGSQSILFYHPNIIHQSIISSYEIDILFLTNPYDRKILTQLSNNINFVYGYQSDFHEQNFFFIDDMTNEENQRSYVEQFPIDWEERAIVNQLKDKSIRFICLDKYDVALLKLVANRDKDNEYVQALIQGGLLSKKKLLGLLKNLQYRLSKEQIHSLRRKIQLFYELPQINVLCEF